MAAGASKNIRKLNAQFELNNIRVKPNRAGGIKIDMTSMHATIAFIESDDELLLTIIPKESGRIFSSEDLKTIFSEVRRKANKVFNVARGKIVRKIKNDRAYYQIPVIMKEYFYESELLERSLKDEAGDENGYNGDHGPDETEEAAEASDLSASSLEEVEEEMELETSLLLEEDFSEQSGVKGLSRTRLMEELKAFELSPDTELWKLIVMIYKEAVQGLNLGEIIDDMMESYVSGSDPIRKKQLKESIPLLQGRLAPFKQETNPAKKPVSLSFLIQTLFLVRENL